MYKKIEEIEKDIRYLKHRILVINIQRKGHSIQEAERRYQGIVEQYKKLL